MKKLFAGIFVIVLLFSLFSMQVFATTANDYIQYLKNKGFAQEYIIYAQNHFKSYSYTSAQLDALESYSDQMLAIIMPKNPDVITKGGNYYKSTAFTDAEEDQMVDIVVKAANSLGIRAVFTRGPDTMRYVNFYNKSGKLIGTVTPKYNSLKFTDDPFGSTALYLSIAALLILLLGAGTFIVKKSLYTKRAS